MYLFIERQLSIFFKLFFIDTLLEKNSLEANKYAKNKIEQKSLSD